MAPPPAPIPDGIVFRGHSRAAVKRKAVRWWARNATGTLTLRQFLAGCRMDPSERLIVFVPARATAA